MTGLDENLLVFFTNSCSGNRISIRLKDVSAVHQHGRKKDGVSLLVAGQWIYVQETFDDVSALYEKLLEFQRWKER